MPQAKIYQFRRLAVWCRCDGAFSSERTPMVASEKGKKQMQQTSRAKPPAPVADEPPNDGENATDNETASDSDGLSPEQEEALSKIMAEIEGQDKASAKADGAADADVSTEADVSVEADVSGETDGAVADGATDGVSETEAPPADEDDRGTADEDTDSDEGLSPEQEDALNKIMAEIEGQDEASAEADVSANADGAANDAGEAEAPPAGEIDSGPADEDTDSDEGLSPEQEDALNKIMAEIEGRDEASAPADEAANGATEAEAPPADEGDSGSTDEDTDSDEGLSPEQEDALNKIMAEIGDEDASSPSNASPSDSSDSAAPGEAEGKKEDTAGTPETQAATSADETDASGQKTHPSDGSDPSATERSEGSPSDDPAPCTDDLMSQIQAAAQGSEEELTVTPTSMDASGEPDQPSQAAPSRTATSSDDPPPPLAEIEDPSPPKKKATSKPKKPISKKIVKTAVWTGLAAVVVILMAAGTYLWLSRHNAAHTAVAPTASVDNHKGIGADVLPQAEAIQGDAGLTDAGQTQVGLTQTPDSVAAPPNAPEMSPESKRLKALSERIQARRADMLAKAHEIDDLSAYYANGIKQLTQELVARIKERQITDFKSAQKDTAVSMGLETIQRRSGYIEKLAVPREQILAATEELRYLARKADILSMITAKTSGLNLDPFSKQVDEVLERLSHDMNDLSLDETDAAGPALKDIWESVWAAHLKAPKKEPPATLAMRRNKAIWTDVCHGDFARVGELSALSGDAATCLATWEGTDLFLNNLEQLSPEAARNLSKWEGDWLVLNGLKSLSEEAARHLAAWKGKRLSLNGLTDLSPAATRALAKWQGDQIEMIGLRRLDAWNNRRVTLYVSSEVRDNLAP